MRAVNLALEHGISICDVVHASLVLDNREHPIVNYACAHVHEAYVRNHVPAWPTNSCGYRDPTWKVLNARYEQSHRMKKICDDFAFMHFRDTCLKGASLIRFTGPLNVLRDMTCSSFRNGADNSMHTLTEAKVSCRFWSQPVEYNSTLFDLIKRMLLFNLGIRIALLNDSSSCVQL